MAESAPRPDPPAIASVPDPDVRRALRVMYQDLHATIEHHQMEIQALLEMMLEKHVGSIGEYKRHLTRLQQGGVPRSERIQGQIGAVAAPHGMTPANASADSSTTRGTSGVIACQRDHAQEGARC